MKLLACPDCARPYDVVGLDPGTALRCVCGGRMTVGVGDPLAGGVTCGHCGAPVPAGEGVCGHCEAALLKARCAGCGATSPTGSLHCCRCGQGLVCQGLKALPAEARCPRCQHDLGLRVLEGGSAIECPACNGLWLEPGDLATRTRAAATSAGPPLASLPELAQQPVAYLSCIQCGELMQRRRFRWGAHNTPIVLDYCGGHGVWLDGGELEAVLTHARHHGPAVQAERRAERRVPPRTSSAETPLTRRLRGDGWLLASLVEAALGIFSG